MNVELRRATDKDLDAVLSLLAQGGLPQDGLADRLGTTLVATDDGQIVGSAALELYVDGALLRSVVVAPPLRGSGLGHRLTEAATDLARQLRAPALFLLTTTAEDFFPRFGFVRIGRDEVPASVQQSVEFSAACPWTATVMRKALATYSA
jgi:amino-acid N-acetyltransferase